MVIKIPPGDRQKYFTAMAKVESASVPVWPSPLTRLFDPNICGTHFADPPVFGGLLSRIVEQASNLPDNAAGLGGKKVRDEKTWQMAAARLLTWRALLFYCDVHGAEEAHAVDRWANVTRQGEYNSPHAHYECEYSVVYYLDIGEQDPSSAVSGAFELIDPRIPYCCSRRPGYPTRGILPTLVSGLMIGFPAELLHHAYPYSGRRPRISLAWNINPGPPPRDHAIDPTRPVEAERGVTEFKK
jgi:hypothetical protein